MTSKRCLSLHLCLLLLGTFLAFITTVPACVGGQGNTQPPNGKDLWNWGDALRTSEGEKNKPGIFERRVIFGQSAALRGPAKHLGRDMRQGILAAFYEVNQAGGVHGRELKLETMDDAYQPELALHTTRWLIEKREVFALIGSVGTPTTRAAYPLAHAAGIPFLAPVTGAEFLRDPALDNVINLRASYYQETEEVIARLTEDLGVTRIAVLYQDDAYGRDGLEGVRLALGRRGLEPLGTWNYQRHLGGVRHAASPIVEVDPEAVVIIGTHEPVAATVKAVRRDTDAVFMTVSFGSGKGLTRELKKDGHGVYATQVVPFPEDSAIPIVARYHAALSRLDPQAQPGFVSLEGYLAGRLAIFGLDACGRELSRSCFIEGLQSSDFISFDGFQLNYGYGDNQGSDAVFLTVIDGEGKYCQINKLSDESCR